MRSLANVGALGNNVRRASSLARELDVSFVRAQFPAFQEPYLAGKIMAENAGGTYACGRVVTALSTYYRETKVQPGYLFEDSARAAQEMDAAYRSIAQHLNVDQDDVSFGPSTSANVYVLANAFRMGMSAGDEVIVTQQDHEANQGAWRRLEAEGAVVREWKVDAISGRLHVDDLVALLSDKTKLVAFTHCSNVVGHVNPVKQIVDMVREASDAMVVVDGVSYAGHGLPDIQELGAPDVYMFSTYKTYGPHQGIMTVTEDARTKLANQGHEFNAACPSKVLTPAGPDHAQVAACHGISQYFDDLCAWHLGSANSAADGSDYASSTTDQRRQLGRMVHDYEQRLMLPLLDFLTQQEKQGRVRLIGPSHAEALEDPTLKVPTIAFLPLLLSGSNYSNSSNACNAVQLAQSLANDGVGVGFGGFYANRLLQALDIPVDPGVLRLSLVHYNTHEEISKLVDILDEKLGV